MRCGMLAPLRIKGIWGRPLTSRDSRGASRAAIDRPLIHSSRPCCRPGDNLYTTSMVSWNPDSGSMNWYFQYIPGDMWDYDEAHTHILIDGEMSGQPRKLITHAARNGFLYTFERANGQIAFAKPYIDNINWTAGIDQKTGKPVDYDPGKDIQAYSGKDEPDAIAPMPAVRQKRSNELFTSCQAVSRLDTSASDEVVVVLVMALLYFADSTPGASRLKVGNASPPLFNSGWDIPSTDRAPN
jgi:hypothetical protein